MAKQKEFQAIFDYIDFEKIIDHPNILIAANFWEKDRYEAACVCYRFMRKIDDLIDNHKADHSGIEQKLKSVFRKEVTKWLNALVNGEKGLPVATELRKTIDTFSIPVWALEDFAGAMLYDIDNEGFATLEDFISYSGGASVAPASVFVHLAGLRSNNGGYELPPFDVRATALPCAMFSYFVHIMRDFRKDQLNNLNYFADDIIDKHGISAGELGKIARGNSISQGFRGMMREYYDIADSYRSETLKVMEKICPGLEPRYRLSMEIIFDLYRMVFERIDPDSGSFSTEELNPTPAEVKVRVGKVIETFL